MPVANLRHWPFNSHASSEEKCVEIVRTLHVKIFPFGSVKPVGSVTVKIRGNLYKVNFRIVSRVCVTQRKSREVKTKDIWN